uniref:Uncharacterized protein n=1 Tax=Colletotrichum scovillei TaxID=1209932 RepID=A0A9P7U952_9PEZI
MGNCQAAWEVASPIRRILSNRSVSVVQAVLS